MNREELEKEAEEYYYKTYPVTLNIGEEERKKEVTNIFVKGAESREKQIQALGERCLQLQTDKGRLTDEVREYESEAREVNIRFDNAIKKLTEAKEIIRELLKYEMQGAGCVYWKNKAEAFLKE